MNRQNYFLLFSLMVFTVSAWSQPGGGGMGRGRSGGGGGPSGPCADDVQKLCADARSQGRDAVRDCMRAHKDQLSDECRQSMQDKMSSQGGGTMKPQDQNGGGAPDPARQNQSGPPPECKDDLKKFCANAKSQGRDAVKSCMRAHMQEVSQACQDAIATRRKAKADDSAKQGPAGDAEGFKAAVAAISKSCSGERGMLCNGVEPKDGALMRCLMQHYGDAGADCQAALDAAKPYAAKRKAAKQGQDDSSGGEQ